jgi:hypothetical protein
MRSPQQRAGTADQNMAILQDMTNRFTTKIFVEEHVKENRLVVECEVKRLNESLQEELRKEVQGIHEELRKDLMILREQIEFLSKQPRQNSNFGGFRAS